MKKRVFGIDLARVICAFGIMFYHYAVECFGDQSMLYYANGNIAALVASFFIISGITLHMSNRQISLSLKKDTSTGKCELPEFYKKRALSIFPMFYMVFFYLFLTNACVSHTLAWRGPLWTLLLSVIGMDGYLYYKVNTYYMIGEWFLGAIIILYVLYPFLLKLMNRIRWLILIPALLSAAVISYFNCFEMNSFHNPLFIVLPFVIGMLIDKYDLLRNKIFLALTVILFIITLFVPLPVHSNFGMLFFGLGIISVCMLAEKVLIKWGPAVKAVNFLAPLTYPIFLLHHIIITTFTAANMPKGIKSKICVFVGIVFFTVLFAKILCIVESELRKYIAGLIQRNKAQRTALRG